MALLAAILSLVPIFGSIASAVPAVAIGLTQGLGTATFVLFWIIGIHQLEANVLNPKAASIFLTLVPQFLDPHQPLERQQLRSLHVGHGDRRRCRDA